MSNKPTEELTPEEIAALSPREKAIRGLAYSTEIYDADWFQGQAWQHPWCRKLMDWMNSEFGPFESSLDLGAGDGFYSHVLAEGGTEAVAIEVSEEAMSVIADDVQGMVHDLREPLDLGRTYDLIICLEVAEHLPVESSDTLCDTIANHCGRLLLFTSAPPGQGGHGHVNLQPPKFWRDRLEARGLHFWPNASIKTRRAWKNILGKELPWLSRNVLLYGKEVENDSQ